MSSDFLLDGVDLRTLPKISLHDHLDGSLRPATIIELAEAEGIELPVLDAEGLGAWFAEQSNSGSLVEYLKTFDLTCAVMQTREGLTRVARESVIDLANDGVIYGELRWAPEQHLTKGLTLDQTVEYVQEGIEQGIEDAAAQGKTIRIGQLVTAMRHADRSLKLLSWLCVTVTTVLWASILLVPSWASLLLCTRTPSITSHVNISPSPFTPVKRMAFLVLKVHSVMAAHCA
jgi:adenosine deaminase